MEVSGQLKNPVTLSLEKEPPVPIGQEALEPIWMLLNKE
jgi:hypothetical protein